MSEWTPIKKLKPMKYKLTPKYKNGFSWVGDRFCKNNIPWLVANGFIEEDKPEERWINIYYTPGEFAPTITKDGGCFYPTEDIARGYGKSKKGYITTIKLPDKEINK